MDGDVLVEEETDDMRDHVYNEIMENHCHLLDRETTRELFYENDSVP